MSIYTRTGDAGQTSLFGGKRVSKADHRIEACGALDELSSFIGIAAAKIGDEHNKIFLTGIQEDLWRVMGVLAGAKTDLEYLNERVEAFESKIDEFDEDLPELTRFILPGGTIDASLFHICRAVSRRAERMVIRALSPATMKQSSYKTILKYLNRLSDLLFMFARFYGKGKEVMT